MQRFATCGVFVAMVIGLIVGAQAGVGAPVPPTAPLPPPTPAQMNKSKNNLKQIVLAMINYSDTYGGPLPIDSRSKDGKSLLSWRVAILPFIEEGPLYKQFKQDEPWDSDHNKKLIEKMPKILAPVRVTAKPGETFYQVFSGENALFGPKAKPKFPVSIPDGTSNTGMVFEAGEPVVWTKPADLPFDEKKPLPKLGGLFDGVFHVGICDGSIRRCRKDADVDELRKLIMPADGNVINDNLLFEK
jgi:hypothetical protein